MAIEYLGLSSLNGPLAVLEGVSGAAYDEIVEMTVNGKEKKLGRIIEVYEDKAVIQVFESTENMALRNTHTRLTGHPMEIGVSVECWGAPSTASEIPSTAWDRSLPKNGWMSTESP